jgi:hypothetical protein
MTYEVHITRRESWSDESSSKVAREDWLRVVSDDDALVLAAGGGPSAVWNGHPRKVAGLEREGVLFLFSDWGGWLSVDQPDDDTLVKMIDVAGLLQATVRGDDGEIYEIRDGGVMKLHLGAPVRFARGEPVPSVQQADGPLHREQRRESAADAQKRGRGRLRRVAGRMADRLTRKILG